MCRIIFGIIETLDIIAETLIMLLLDGLEGLGSRRGDSHHAFA
jgi:hypothetical protein